MEVTEEGLEDFFLAIVPMLDERQRRIVAGGIARLLGRGGVTAVAQVAAMSRNTVIDGTEEYDEGPEPSDRIRREGAVLLASP